MHRAGVGDKGSDRHGIIAGGGPIPIALAQHLSEQGQAPFVFLVEGEADSALEAFPHAHISMADMAGLLRTARREGLTHLTLIGTASRRPDLRQIRPNLSTLALVPRIVGALARGDDVLLSAVVGLLEAQGFTVVGAHELMPGWLVQTGAIGAVKPGRSHTEAIRVGLDAARALGALDAGQGVVVIGKRIVALEGAEGTDAMLSRVADLKANGRLKDARGGVLVKLSKPGQELRVDMPTIGLRTLEGAHAAQLHGIVAETGRTLLMDRDVLVKKADEWGMFVVGHGAVDG